MRISYIVLNHTLTEDEMQHNYDCTTQYPKLCIKTLNKHGALSTPWLIVKLQVQFYKARCILQQIANDYSNVTLVTEDKIVIEGWERHALIFEKRKRSRIWKDVTRP